MSTEFVSRPCNNCEEFGTASDIVLYVKEAPWAEGSVTNASASTVGSVARANACNAFALYAYCNSPAIWVLLASAALMTLAEKWSSVAESSVASSGLSCRRVTVAERMSSGRKPYLAAHLAVGALASCLALLAEKNVKTNPGVCSSLPRQALVMTAEVSGGPAIVLTLTNMSVYSECRMMLLDPKC